MVDVTCPVCGKTYTIPEGRGRAIVETHFLRHKDRCELPREDEYVRVRGRIGVVIEADVDTDPYPRFEVQMPSGRNSTFRASEVVRVDQEEGRRRFYE